MFEKVLKFAEQFSSPGKSLVNGGKVWKNGMKSCWQRAKKVVSASPGAVDFAFGPVNSVLNLPDGQVMFLEEFKLKKNCEINFACRKAFGAS